MAAEDVIRLEGVYLGRSDQPQNWRLYLTQNFTRYLEFRRADTIHSERLASGSVVAWVRSSGPIAEASAEATVPADFLQGGLLDTLGRANDAETIRRVLGLGMGLCGIGEDKDKKPKSSAEGTVAPQASCPNPQSCSTPGCCQI
jgi:hypothetical protein